MSDDFQKNIRTKMVAAVKAVKRQREAPPVKGWTICGATVQDKDLKKKKLVVVVPSPNTAERASASSRHTVYEDYLTRDKLRNLKTAYLIRTDWGDDMLFSAAQLKTKKPNVTKPEFEQKIGGLAAYFPWSIRINADGKLYIGCKNIPIATVMDVKKRRKWFNDMLRFGIPTPVDTFFDKPFDQFNVLDGGYQVRQRYEALTIAAPYVEEIYNTLKKNETEWVKKYMPKPAPKKKSRKR